MRGLPSRSLANVEENLVAERLVEMMVERV
jgi:hypothetical protein